MERGVNVLHAAPREGVDGGEVCGGQVLGHAIIRGQGDEEGAVRELRRSILRAEGRGAEGKWDLGAKGTKGLVRGA